AVANRAYGHPRADELARRLADPAVEVVVAGQQPGLFGGPLYTLSKLLAAARWAAALEAAGRPAVAVFWVATEDHDWHEVSRATFPAPDGPRELALGDDPEPLAPVGVRTLGPGLEAALAALREAMPGDRYGAWIDTLARWYRPDARFGEAFCRLMVELAGERCPLLLDALLPALKVAERPHLARLVERRREVEEALAAADDAIARRGFPHQVNPQRGVSPLFLFAGGERRRIAWEGDGCFELRGGAGGRRPVGDLLAAVAENPEVVSPGVLARPAVEDAVLGTTLLVLGPGETSYLPQAAPVYRVLEVAPPAVALRPQVLVLESHQLDRLAETGLSLAELLAPEERLDALLAERAGSDFTAAARQRIAALLAELEGPALALDPNLERPYAKTRDHVTGALDTFAGKVRSAAARRDEVASGRIARLRETALPGGRLQERVVASAHFPGKYGRRFAEAVWQQMELDGATLQVVTP
ncbi:MAG TPA: bacillithiol biosynthesis cysteine-adding enzyme BshC, partial [Thermoanaerobaculia bacterium]|nr:bacillithiol biosynthesis cysteine-adding enzyme BshC [Thermoanaerobaculia bacterium]